MPTPTPTATRSLTPTPTPSPTATPAGAGIHGRVTLNAVAAAGLLLELQRKDGGAWMTVAETETNAGGLYNFTGAAALAAGQEYRVSYANAPDDPNPGPGYLWSWWGQAHYWLHRYGDRMATISFQASGQGPGSALPQP